MAKRSITPKHPGANGESGGARTLIERAYEQLRADIIEGRLAPGEKLRVEHLKDHYEVSAGTLREAITRLVSDALVVAEGQRGFRVAPIALEELEDITRLRVQIETEALRQSIQAGDGAWREAVHAAYAALSDAEPIVPARRREWELLNLRFHEALLSGHASPWTLRVLRLLSRHSERYRSVGMHLPGSQREVHAEHTEIYEYAMAGQEARAALALEAHIRATPDALIRALREGRITLPSADAHQVGEALLA
ncbi:GntR family transcriptional regulator [Comamonas sp. NLF-1-9]|uniref:GntR family transcriptional regulator n=1 Tax=Comamonas sp. NLF-1-9 TaxID=2853163 RepID=UPI001C4516B6|nr:GntR family transcriptional regulator [Comamonas sp. NLF-1-9]QXL83759.1 GntR family transcriptional regulator [Comamonas sp. NLF-1-9]